MEKLLFLTLLLLGLTLTAQDAPIDRTEVITELSNIQQVINTYHPNAYFYRDSSEVNAFRKDLSEQLPSQPTKMDVYRTFSQFVNYFNDGHTRVYASELVKQQKESGHQFLPFEVAVDGDQMTISRSYQGGSARLEGQRITSINGIKAAELAPLLRRFVSRETDDLDDVLLSHNFSHYLWLATGWNGPFTLTLTDRATPITVEGLPYEAMRNNVTPTEPIVDYRVLDDQIAYLKIRQFYGMSRKDFRRAYAAAFDHFREQGATEQLIVDVRDHDGGDHRFGVDLARYFADEKFNDFTYSIWKATPTFKEVFKKTYLPGALHWSLPLIKGFNPHLKAIYGAEDNTNARVEYPEIKPQAPRKRYPGEVFVVTDENTFSAGTTFMSLIKDNGLATIVGRPSGNVANFHADALLRYQLPFIDGLLRISTSFLVRPSGDMTHAPVQPDVLLDREEDALQHTITIIKGKEKAPASYAVRK